MITVQPGGSYAEVMRKAAASVDLKDLNISGLRVKKAANGNMLLRIPGEKGEAKADTLVKKVSEVFKNQEGVRFTRPVKHGEVRVRNVVPLLSAKEVAETLAAAGNCEEG